MVFAGIVAGGSGTRMKNAALPKQFIKIGDLPIIIHTLKVFLQCKEIDRIFIGINPDWHDYMQELIKKYNLNNKKIRIVNGGKDRNSTIMNIVNSIENIGQEDIIITHDAVRPFVTKAIIEKHIEMSKSYKALGTYIPAVDTIVFSEKGEFADKNLPREFLYQAQTPQTFKLTALLECMKNLADDELAKLTDTCGIFTANNIPIKMIKGDPINFKITTPFDLEIANALLQIK